MTADGGIRFGNYVLLRRIARGGMAEVFLAQQRGLEGFDRRVAVKRILPHLADSPDFVKMFLGEAKLAAQLTHPNIVHIYDFGKVDHDYFIAMEYVEGVHAGQLFKQRERERMPVTMIARIGADAAAALNYAHELHGPTGQPLGIVHRDVSPANLMISYDGVVKLCDFGIAKAAALSDQRTNPGQVKGKYAYMSPEQTVAGPLDGRSDVFSLAIVLWELIAGKMIVSRGDPIAAMRAIRDGKLQPIAQAAPGVPPPLADAITWALSKRREGRATAAELATALEAFIKASPELATPMQVGAWVRARFPREALTGPQRAIRGDPAAGPSTLAVPGTVGGTSGTGTRIVPVTPLSSRSAGGAVAPEADDLTETIAITGDPDAGAETIIVEDSARPVAKRITARQLVAAAAAAPPDRPTLLDPSLRAGREPAPRPPAPAAPHERPTELALPGGPRPLAPAPASQAPSPDPRLRPPPLLTGTETIAHVRPPRRLALLVALVGIAVASFLVALVVRSPGRPATTPAAVAPAPAADAAPAPAADAAPAITAPAPPPDAAPTSPAGDAAAPAIDAPAPEPPPPDVRPRLQGYKVDTRPSGGTVRIGARRRVAPASFLLPPGRHTVVAELDGWQPETRAIVITDGSDLAQEIPFTRRIHIVRAPQIGTLTVRTTPYSDVYLGTRKIGQAPFADKEVPAGTHWLTFKNPLHPTVRKQVTIVAGRLTKLAPFNLPPRE